MCVKSVTCIVDKKEHWKKDLTCPVCGNGFKGTAKAVVCSPTCRTRLRRIVDAGNKPEYYLIVKSKGQKLPPLLSEKQAKKQKVEIKDFNEQSNGITQNLTEPPKTTNVTIDIPPLTEEQKIKNLKKTSELNQQLKAVQAEQCPTRMHPKIFQLDKDDRIKEINEQIEKLNP